MDEDLYNATGRPRSVPTSSNGQSQAALNHALAQDFVLSLSKCNTIGELVRLIPVPVQPCSRDILDGVYQASQKLGTAEALLKFWQDKLRSSDFTAVSQLNSLRAPAVQISKEALLAGNGGLSSLNLDTVLHECKKNALTQLIFIKDAEVQALRDFVQSTSIVNRIAPAWKDVLTRQASALTDEHSTIISSPDAERKVAQVAASIGESSYQRVRLAKEKRAVTKKEADINMTDASEPQGKKQMMMLVEEALKRKEQSRRDRTSSGKGRGSSSVSKNKPTRSGGGPGRSGKGRPGRGKNGRKPPERQRKKR